MKNLPLESLLSGNNAVTKTFRHFSLFNVPRDLGVSKKLPWESFLSGNNALTKTFLFLSHHDFNFSVLFFLRGPLGAKTSLRGHIRTH